MSLKRQFALLITGILLIPFLTIAVSIGIFQLTSTAERMIFDLRKDRNIIDRWLQTDVSEPLTGLSNQKVVVIAPNGTILHGASEGEDIQQLVNNYDAISVWLQKDGQQFQVLHMFEKNSWESFEGTPLTMILVPSFLLLFVATMSIWILRTFQSKLKVLVTSTQRIGQNDLSTQVQLSGHDELAEFAHSLDSMRLELKRAGEDRKRLLMGISHDLKTPLSGIKGYVQALRDGLAEDENQREKYLSIIADKSALLEQRIASLIEYVKLESAEWRAEPSEVKVQDLSSQWFAEFENDLSVAGYSCVVSNNMPHGTSSQFDSGLVRRALDNLVSNAMKYSPAQSLIHLTATLKQTHYCFIVENEGEAFSEDEREKLFSPFFRGDKGRNTDGLGLGLTVVEKVAQLHHGEAIYDYHNGRHQFSLMLPFIR